MSASVLISVRIPADVRAAIDARCVNNGTTLSDEINRALARLVKQPFRSGKSRHGLAGADAETRSRVAHTSVERRARRKDPR